MLPLLLILSVSIFLISFFNKKFEDGIHLSLFISLFTLYTFGILNQLLLGVYVLSISIILIYILSIYNLIKTKEFSSFAKNLFTDGFFIFIILYVLCYFVTKDRIPYTWDEFSHWCDTVKIMYMYDDLPTKTIYYGAYPHYPPGISLLQYLFLKLDNNYSEWIIYFTQKIFALTLIIPFVKHNKKLNPILRVFKILLISISSFVFITLFGSDFYTTAYIDTFLGIVFGFGFAYIFLFDIRKPIHFLTISLTIFALCIIKEAGTTFAIALSIILAIELIRNREYYENKTLFILIGTTILSSLYPLKSWSYYTTINDALTASSREFSLSMLFTLGENHDDAYRIETLNNFYAKIFSKDLEVLTSLTSHFFIFTIMFIIFAILIAYCLFYKLKGSRLERNSNLNKSKIYIICGLYLVFILYTIGLLISYMYFFMEYEAVRLASFDRYMFILYTGFVVFVLGVVINIFNITKKHTLVCSAICIFTLLMFNYTHLKKSFNKDDVVSAVAGRENLNVLVDNFRSVTDPDINDNILLVVQNTSGFLNRQMKYLMRPDNVTKAVFSFGTPYSDGDIWTKDYTLVEWEEFIFDKFGYEYIMMMSVDLQFIEKYKDTFDQPENIKNHSVFKINQEKRIIECVYSDDGVPNIYDSLVTEF